jgi:RecB family exonuclease
VAAARWIALHPRLGLLPEREALLAATASAGGAGGGTAAARAAALRLSALDEASAAALAATEALERFGPEPACPHDGLTGMGLGASHQFSPTSLESLGRCPLQFFVERLLRAGEIPGEPLAHRLEENLLGDAAHATLRAFYQELRQAGAIGSPLAPASAAAAGAPPGLDRAMLAEIWQRELARAAGPVGRRLKGLFAALGRVWLRELERFIASDLETLREEGWEELELEVDVSGELPVGDAEPLRVGGRLDRLLRAGARRRLDDYKTSPSLAKRLLPAALLRLESLQLPLYRELVALRERLPALAIGCGLLGVGPRAAGAEDLAPRLLPKGDVREGFLESLAVVARLARAGLFPAWPDEAGHCRACSHRPTCRKGHEPSIQRLEADARLADFRDVKRKVSGAGRHLLAGLRREADGGAEAGEPPPEEESP